MATRVSKTWILIAFLCKPVMSRIIGPIQLNHTVGETVHFIWNTHDNSTITSVAWGIKKANIADPQFISVNIRSNKIYFNLDLAEDLIRRVSFHGDLEKGRAWFILKNATVNDTNEYLASITDSAFTVLPYTVVLTVEDRKRKHESDFSSKKPKEEWEFSSRIPKTVFKTSMTKERETVNVLDTEAHEPKEPKQPNNYNNVEIIVILVSIPVVLILAALIAFFVKKRVKDKPKSLKKGEKHSQILNRLHRQLQG